MKVKCLTRLCIPTINTFETSLVYENSFGCLGLRHFKPPWFFLPPTHISMNSQWSFVAYNNAPSPHENGDQGLRRCSPPSSPWCARMTYVQLLNASVGLEVFETLASAFLQCSQCYCPSVVHPLDLGTLVHWWENVRSAVEKDEHSSTCHLPEVAYTIFFLTSWFSLAVCFRANHWFRIEKKNTLNFIKQNMCSGVPCTLYTAFLECQPPMQTKQNLGNKAALKLNIACQLWRWEITLLEVKFECGAWIHCSGVQDRCVVSNWVKTKENHITVFESSTSRPIVKIKFWRGILITLLPKLYFPVLFVLRMLI